MTPEEREVAMRDRRERRTEAVARSAAPLPDDLTVLDVSLGWPHVLELRLGVGVADFLEDAAGLVAGIAIRTMGRVTEFEGRTQFGWRPIRQISLGGVFRFGGGIGRGNGSTSREQEFQLEQNMVDPGRFPNCTSAMDCSIDDHPTNTVFMALDALFTLHFSRAGAFTLWLGFDAYSDRWDFQASDSNAVVEDGYRDRQRQARLRLGGSLEIVINRRWNAWGLFESVVASPSESRRLYSGIYGIDAQDTELYGRVGFTYKFGSDRLDPNEQPRAPDAPEAAPELASPAEEQ